jgi:hypothetical protein
VTYAYDITLFVTFPADIPGVREATRTYERATVASLNIRISKAQAAGSWDAAVDMMDISYCPGRNILGVYLTSSIDQSGNTSWTRVTGQVRALAKDVYGRDLCLTQRIQYVPTYLLVKIWRIAQVFPIPKEHLRQLATAISWYIRKGAILQVAL